MSNISVTEALEEDLEEEIVEIPTVKGFFHSFLRFGYELTIAHMQSNVQEWGLPQEDFNDKDPPKLSLVS